MKSHSLASLCLGGHRVATERQTAQAPPAVVLPLTNKTAGDPGILLLLVKFQRIVPIFYMASTIGTLVFTIALFGNYGEISSWPADALGLWNINTIIYSILILVLEKRIKQYEIIQGFVSVTMNRPMNFPMNCLPYVRLSLNNHQNALQSKRSFVRYISHEVRTPLNTGAYWYPLS
jgi:signal transduction histidine kinase